MRHGTGAKVAALALLAVAMTATAAELPRKAFFGIGGSPAEHGPGLLVTRVLDGATGAMAGLREADVIQAVNATPVHSMSDLISLATTLVAGDAVTFSIQRAAASLELRAAATGRPMEASGNFEVLYGAVAFDAGQLRSIIYRPRGVGPFPAVYFLQGVTCDSIDYGLRPLAPVRQLVTAWAEAGFAVVRLEKPGVGDSTGEVTCGDMGYTTELAAFAAGHEYLASLTFVDAGKLFYFGHSLGAVTGALLAQEYQPLGVITYGAVVKPWFEYMIDVFREQAVRLGDPYLQIQDTTRMATPFFYDLMIAKKDWRELATRYADIIANNRLPVSGQRVFGRDYTFWAELNDPNLTRAWADFDGAVLALFGSYDIQAISPEGAETIAAIVNAYPPGAAESRVLESAEHGLSRYPGPFEDYVADLGAGRWTPRVAGEHFDSRIARQTIEWMRSAAP